MEFLQILIAKGANVNVEDNYMRKSALNLAIGHGYCQIMELLLQNGADCNRCDSFGFTPIMMAVNCDNLDNIDNGYLCDPPKYAPP